MAPGRGHRAPLDVVGPSARGRRQAGPVDHSYHSIPSLDEAFVAQVCQRLVDGLAARPKQGRHRPLGQLDFAVRVRLIEKELASGERQAAGQHWCELVQRVRRVEAPARLLIQLAPVLGALGRKKEALQTLQLAACSPDLSPGMALRVVDLAANVDAPSTLRAARIALTSADLHETKRARLRQLANDLTAQGVREIEPPTDQDPLLDRSLEIAEDDFRPPVVATAPSDDDSDGRFALSADGSLVTGEDEGYLSGALYDETTPQQPGADAAPQTRHAPAPPPPEPFLDPDGLDFDDMPATPGLALHGLDLEAEEMEAVGALVDETPSTDVDYRAGANAISGAYSAEDEDAEGPRDEATDALDAIAMGVALDSARFSDAKVVEAIPLELGADRLALQQSGGRRGHVEFARVDAVSVAAIQGLGPKPVVLLDLLANWTSLEGGVLRLIRLRSDQFDARALVPDAEDGVEAFKMLTQILLEQCAAVALPNHLAAVGQPFRVCEQLEDYERDILQIDR